MSRRVRLASTSHAAGVRIIRSAAGDRKHAGAGGSCNQLGVVGGRGGLCAGHCTGKNESDNESPDDVFHSEIPLKLYSQKKIFLDKPNEVTIG